jgi:hypothetical protein
LAVKVGTVSKTKTVAYDPKVHDAAGAKVPSGAKVRIVEPGYSVTVGRETVVVRKPVVEVAERPLNALPSRNAKTAGEIMGGAADRDFREVEAQIQRVVEGEFPGGIRTRLRTDHSGITHYAQEDSLVMNGDLIGPSGRSVGSFIRRISRNKSTGELVADHDHLEISRGLQGSGFAEAFNRNLYDWYRRSGITRVELTANIDVGGYAWARAGFDFATPAVADDFLTKAIARIDKTKRLPTGITRDQLDDLRRYLVEVQSGRIPAHAADIAEFGRQTGQGGKAAIWAGKWVMLKSAWRGVLYL